MSSGLKKYKLGDFLDRIKDGINLVDSISYKRATIRINNKGISVRDELLGKNIKTKRQFLISEGQFLMSKIDARNGAFGIVPKELDNGIITGNFWTFNVDDSIILGEFFKNFTLAPKFIEICSKASTGSTNRKYLNEAKFLDIEITIPSIAEQKIILKKIDSIRVNHSKLMGEINSQEVNLAKLRQSILQDAVQGKLTEGWREKNATVEPASELLQKIKTENEQLIKEKKIKKEKPLLPITKDEIPFEIPESWEWCRLSEVCKYIQRGKSPKYTTEQKIPVISQKCVQWSGFDISKAKFITEESLEKYVSERYLQTGDLLWNSTGDGTVGRVNLYPGSKYEKVVADSHVTVVRSFKKYVLPSYLWIFTASPFIQNIVSNRVSGSTKQTELGTGTIKQMEFCFPSIKEQKSIVEKVNRLFAHCDILEKEIKTSKTNAEKLMQSVLSELLGEENNTLVNKTTSKKEIKKPSREIKYNSKTLLMDLVKLLKENGKLHAEDLWKMSKYPNDIDAFYAELKKQIEQEKTIKESKEKGYLELV